MTTMSRTWRKRMKRTGISGQGLVETGLVMALIAIFAVATIWVMADFLGERYQDRAANQTQSDTQFYTQMARAAGDTHMNTTSIPTTVYGGPSTTTTTAPYTSTYPTTSPTTTTDPTTTTSPTTTPTDNSTSPTYSPGSSGTVTSTSTNSDGSTTTTFSDGTTTTTYTDGTTTTNYADGTSVTTYADGTTVTTYADGSTTTTTPGGTTTTTPPPSPPTPPPANTAPTVWFVDGSAATPAAGANIGGANQFVFFGISDVQDSDAVNTQAYASRINVQRIGPDSALITIGYMIPNPWKINFSVPNGNHDFGIRITVTDFGGLATTIERSWK